MKSILFCMLLVSLKSFAEDGNKAILKGKITEAKTGTPIGGAYIYLPDFKSGTVSNLDGEYKLENLPNSKVLVQVSQVGYKSINVPVELDSVTIVDFVLEESVAELHEVVITGLSQATELRRAPAPISTISNQQLSQVSSTNIIDAIARQPGLSQITTGSGISKPVIRGLGYNRVLVVNDGIRQEGQQWGDEHGIEIDENAVNRVEILKGPASLSYGSDAMAGVIHFLPSNPVPEGNVKGNVMMQHQSNNGLWAGSVNMSGNEKGFIWDVRYSAKEAHAYRNRYDGYVFNSGYKENTVTGTVGLNKSWGFSHVSFSQYAFTPGIVEGNRDGNSGLFTKSIALNDSTLGDLVVHHAELKSYALANPFQKVNHSKIVLNNNFVMGQSSFKTIIGWQQNIRREYSDPFVPDQYGLYLNSNTVNYDFRYSLPEVNGFTASFGLNGMYQNSLNKGTEFLIPDYRLFDIGFYSILKKSWKKLELNGGLRYDHRGQHGLDLKENTVQLFKSFDANYSGITGSIGISYLINETLYSKLNLSRGFRAPNIAEISAHGVHEGTINYIIGSNELRPEQSLQLDYSLGYNSEHITAEANLFYNSINHYIFLQKVLNTSGQDSITKGFSTFKYTSGDAVLYGGEFSIDIHPHPLDWLHFENSFSIVHSMQPHQPDSIKYLPFTPPAKFSSELKANFKKLKPSVQNAFFKIGIDRYFSQNHFYSAYQTETATPGYTLIHAALGFDFTGNHSHPIFSLYCMANNIADIDYQSHLSRLKYADTNHITGRTGVYNMGRNFTFKLMIPINIRSGN